MVSRSLSVALAAAALAIQAGAVHAAVEISSEPTQNMNCSGGVCSPTAKRAILNVTDLANMLASGDVSVQSGSLAQDIVLDAALSWTSAHRLTLDSYHDIAFNRPVTVAGTGALTVTTSDGGSGGDFRFFRKGQVEFWDTHSSLVINGHNYVLLSTLKEFRRALRDFDGSGHFYALAKNWNLSGTTFSAPPIDKSFNGTLDGLGNSISHLAIRNSATGIGLFQSLFGQAVVRDLNLRNVDLAGTVAGGQAIGALAAGGIPALVQGIHVSGQISASGEGSYVGGILGTNAGNGVVGSSSDAVITAAAGSSVGGLIGWNGHEIGSPDIAASAFAGSISGGAVVGGIVGKADAGTISNTYATGSVTGESSAPAGGLVGIRSSSDTMIEASYSTGAR